MSKRPQGTCLRVDGQQKGPYDRRMYSYCIHGMNIKSSIPLKESEDLISTIDITIESIERRPDGADVVQSHVLKSHDQEERALLSKHQDGSLSIDYFDCGFFYLKKKTLYVLRIHSDPDFFSAVLTTQILPLVSSLFRVTLHGGVAVVDQKAAIYLGNEGAGKSTLTTYLSQKGHRTLSDDVAAIDNNLTVFPGLPEIRINQDSCQKLLSSQQASGLQQKLAKQQIVMPHKNMKPVKLHCIFLLAPTESTASAKLSPLATSESFLALIENQFRWDLWSPQRLQSEFLMLATLCQKIPITRLEYPFTYDSLLWVEEQIERSLRGPQ